MSENLLEQVQQLQQENEMLRHQINELRNEIVRLKSNELREVVGDSGFDHKSYGDLNG